MNLSRTLRYAIATLVILVGITASVGHARAINEFATELESTYTVEKSGRTQVLQKFIITNQVSTVFATEYAVEVGIARIDNVRVKSDGTFVTPTVTAQSNSTIVSFQFPKPVVGKGKSHTVELTYTTDDLAIISSSTIELTIPKLSKQALVDSYRIVAKVPQEYGSPTIVTQKDFTTSTEGSQTVVRVQSPSQEKSTSMLFGKEQTSRVELRYDIQNTTQASALVPIAIPSDTSYQRVVIESIDPVPDSMSTDQDGNWLAHYQLDASERLSIAAKLLITTSLFPSPDWSEELRDPRAYLGKDTHWDVNNSTVQKKAKELGTARAIYDYVVSTLVYDASQIGIRTTPLGAAKTLENPTQALCMEFTDTFIALARAAGIPARAVTGYAMSRNETLRPVSRVRDVLHTWPEYWDEVSGRWIPVDPTWENTTGGVDYFSKLDFNHLAFVKNGISSEYPLPAGMYQHSESQGKTVTVEIAQRVPDKSPTFATEMVSSPKALLGRHNAHSLRLTNTSLFAVYETPYTIRVENSAGRLEKSGTLTLGPLHSKDIPLQLPKGNIFSAYASIVTGTVGGVQFSYELSVKSTVQENLALFIVAFVVAILCGSIAFFAWRLLVPRSKR